MTVVQPPGQIQARGLEKAITFLDSCLDLELALRQVTLSGAGELCLVTHPLEPLVGTTDVDLGTER
jgi:hypothetical protein